MLVCMHVCNCFFVVSYNVGFVGAELRRSEIAVYSDLGPAALQLLHRLLFSKTSQVDSIGFC